MSTILKPVLLAGALTLAAGAAQATVLTFDSTADCSTAEVTITAGAAAGACSGASGPGGSQMLVRSSLRGDSFWTATFASLVDGISVDLGDFNADEDRLFVSAFDALDALLETVTLDIDASDRTMHTLSLTATNVAKITFGITGDLGTGSGIYADNLTFSSAMSPVPLPAGGLLILTGLGGLALMRRRRS